MTWAEKELQKHKMRKQVEEILNSPEHKEMQKKMEEQAKVNALAWFCFIACGYLETRHGYKNNGLKKFLAFARSSLNSAEDEELFFKEYDTYYKDEFGLDVLAEFGLELEEE